MDCEAHGIQVLFLPKFHCELNFIDRCWGYAKRVYRLNPQSSLEKALKTNALATLDAVPLESMRRERLYNASALPNLIMDTIPPTAEGELQLQVAKLETQVAEMTKSHANEVKQLRDQLILSLQDHKQTAERLLLREMDLYELRKLVCAVSGRLIARERHSSTACLEDQMAETQRLMLSIGGQLRDGMQGALKRIERLEKIGDPMDSD
ncbi:hypothetical protein C8R47DRAFT_1068113 [Mycena vitilis]|nr:hypothetical protein C8R47DRAFT_1068113 [Mycena vitilis]